MALTLTNALLLLVVVALFVLLSLVISQRWLLALTVWSAVFQFHSPIPFAEIFPPLTLLLSWMLWPRAVRNTRALLFAPALIAAALLAVWAGSLTWSVDARLGVRTIIYTVPFLFVFVAACAVARREPEWIVKVLAIFGALSLIEAALVVVFRMRPDIENNFLHSSLAGLFISPNTLEVLFDLARNNALDPVKAGGFFVNANPAGAFLGVSAVLTWTASLWLRQRWLKAVALMLWAAIFFTGSKAAAMCAVLVPLTAWVVWLLTSKLAKQPRTATLSWSRVVVAVAAVSAVAIVAAAGLVFSKALDSDFAQESSYTLSSRAEIWRLARDKFLEQPLRGLGFGGWELAYAAYSPMKGITPNMPPHNTLINLWATGGLVAALLGVAFIFSVMWIGLRLLRSRNLDARVIGLGTAVAFAWMFAQGMGENFGLFGDMHVLPPLAAALGLTYVRLVNSNTDTVAAE